MRPKSIALLVSLAANVALACSVTWAAYHPGTFSSFRAWIHPDAPAVPSPILAKTVVAEPRPVAWAGLAKGDLASLAAKLRAAGFPTNVIRAIISAEVQDRFRSRIRELLSQLPNTPYWRQRQGGDPKISSELQAISREETAMIKDLLGPGFGSDNEMMSYYRKIQFGDLPSAKSDQVQGIVSDYNDLRMEIYQNATGGVYLPSDRKQFAYLQQQQDADLANVLSPDELLEYQMRSSQTASQLRYSLQAFDATEDEYKTIFKIEQAADGGAGPQFGPLTQDEMQQRQAQQAQANAQIEAALGPDRYAQYTMDIDGSYKAAYAIAQRLSLPANAPAQVYAVQQDISQQATAVRQDNMLSPADRNAQLAALGQAASSRVTAILGPDGTAAYVQNGGNWLQNLQNSAKAAPRGP